MDAPGGSASDPISLLEDDEEEEKQGTATPLVLEVDGEQIRERDLARLDGENWLNNAVVNGYLLLCIRHFFPPDTRKVLLLESYFYYKLTKDNAYMYSERYMKRLGVNPLDYDWLFAPLHVNKSHWTLAIVKPRDRIIMYADSLGGLGYEHMRHIHRFLCDESLQKRKEDISKDWQTRDLNSIVPRQSNSSDCGVYTCMVARVWMEYIAGGGVDFPESFGFSGKDGAKIRERMKAEIRSGTLFT